MNNIYSVTELNNYIKEKLDEDRTLTQICCQGEISNYKFYPSGHHYFSLKDNTGTLKCVMFKSDAYSLKIRLENGMNVIAFGKISVYLRDGVYQLCCSRIIDAGAGQLRLAYERLKRQLSEEGLFDLSHKKSLPRIPNKIALVTSIAGAAVHDMIRILGRRWPLAEVMVVPVSVQGSTSAAEVAEAIQYVNRFQLADLIITGRGGGSIEDLWSFNEEIVARAIFASSIPVISAIGHEPDITIADYVADRRASTPSNGAEIAVPDQREMTEFLHGISKRLELTERKHITSLHSRLDAVSSSIMMHSPSSRINNSRQYLDSLNEKINYSFSLSIKEKRLLCNKYGAAIEAMSPMKTLLRGYSVVMAEDSVASSVLSLSEGQNISVIFTDGTADCTVDSIHRE